MTTEEAVQIAEAAYGALDYDALGRAEWRMRVSLVEIEFAKNLHKANPTSVPDLIWRRAWADGHSSGYYSVAGIYEEIAEIVQAAEKEARA